MNTESKNRKILFLDKVFLRGKKSDAVTGAERFNIHLVRELTTAGNSLTIYSTKCWKAEIESICKSSMPKVCSFSMLVRVAWPKAIATVFSLLLIDRNKYDVIIMGNVGRIILPIIKLTRIKFPDAKLVLIAHREPTRLYLRLLQGLKPRILAVNSQIADRFRQAGYPDTEVYFGEIRKDHFGVPRDNSAKNGNVEFCVFGNLDPEWKGSDVAVEAFRSLPSEIRSKSRLHLAGFSKEVPDYGDKNILTYPWISEEKVPEFLSSMDVAIIPSRDTEIMKETFSQASVQAMLSGLPLIVSSLPVLRDKIEQGGGVVFSDTKGLSKQMQKLYADADLRTSLGIEAREQALSRFSWSTKYFVDRFLP